MKCGRTISIGYLLLFAAALSIRALHLMFIHDEAFFVLRFGDALRYHQWARTIADGDWVGEGVFYQAPLYPYFLACIYKLFGDSVLTVAIVQSVLGSVACVLLAIAGHRWFRHPRVGFIAGAMLAVYPTAIFFDGLIQKSALDGFLMCAMLAVIAASTRPRGWITVGVMVGLLALVRENALVFAALLVLWQWRAGKETPESGSTRLAGIGCLLLGMAMVLLPVAMRNQAVGGEFHLTTSQFGPNLYIGNHAESDGIYRALRFGRGDPNYERNDAALLAEQDLGRDLSPGEVSRYWVKRTVGDIRADPVRWVKLMGRKVMLLVNRVEVADTEDQYTYAAASPVLVLQDVFSFGLLLALAVGGFTVARRRKAVRLLALLCAGYAVTVVAFYVMSRYRYPLASMLMLPAALLIVHVHRAKRRWWVGVICLGVMALSFVPLVNVGSMRATTLYNTATQLEGDAAVAYYDQALRFDANYPVAWTARGQAMIARGDYPEAEANFREAIALQPDFADAYAGLARVAMMAGRTDDAEAQWLAALQWDPNLAGAHGDLGVLYATEGKLTAATRHLRRAVELDPHNAQAHFNLALCLHQQGDNTGAAAALREALAIDPNHAAAGRLLGELQRR